MLSDLSNQYARFASAAEAAFARNPDLTVALAIVLLTVGVVVAWVILASLVRTVRNLLELLHLRSIRAVKDHRALVVFGAIRGARGGKLRKAMIGQLEGAFEGWALGAGAQIRLLNSAMPSMRTYPSADTARLIVERTEHLANKTQADVMVWGQVRGWFRKTLSLCLLSVDPVSHRREVARFDLRLGKKGEIPEPVLEALAYSLTRRARPVLPRARDYRLEMVAPMVSRLEELRAAQPKDLDTRLRGELDSDFASGALGLGEHLNDVTWLSKSIDTRKKHLATLDRSGAPLTWGAGQEEIGRAMLALALRSNDRPKIEDAKRELTVALDALRTHDTVSLAESIQKSLARADQALDAPRRMRLQWPMR